LHYLGETLSETETIELEKLLAELKLRKQQNDSTISGILLTIISITCAINIFCRFAIAMLQLLDKLKKYCKLLCLPGKVDIQTMSKGIFFSNLLLLLGTKQNT